MYVFSFVDQTAFVRAALLSHEKQLEMLCRRRGGVAFQSNIIYGHGDLNFMPFSHITKYSGFDSLSSLDI